jgi:hypothetical protein
MCSEVIATIILTTWTDGWADRHNKGNSGLCNCFANIPTYRCIPIIPWCSVLDVGFNGWFTLVPKCEAMDGGGVPLRK